MWYGVRKVFVEAMAEPLKECANLMKQESAERKEKYKKKREEAAAAGRETETDITRGLVNLGGAAPGRIRAAQKRKADDESALEAGKLGRKAKAALSQAAKLVAARAAFEQGKLPTVGDMKALIKEVVFVRKWATTITSASPKQALTEEWTTLKGLLGASVTTSELDVWPLWAELRGKKSVSCLTERRMRKIGKMRKRGSRREGPGLPARTRTISWTYSTTTNWTTRRTLRTSELTGCLAAGGVFENKTKKERKRKRE